MKVDKKNPLHLLSLAALAINAFLSLPLRIRQKKSNRKVIVFYGHKLCGNLLAIYTDIENHHSKTTKPIFLTLDANYNRVLRKGGYNSYLAYHPKTAILLSQASAIVSSHGLHSMSILTTLSSIKFFDVWHGIPFKGFKPKNFSIQHKYDETWVTSPYIAQLYTGKFGFNASKVKITGYARTDILINNSENTKKIKSDFRIPQSKKIVLFAPTWQQDSKHRSIFPFEEHKASLLSKLDCFAKQSESVIIVRAHLNSREKTSYHSDRIIFRSFEEYPNTESLLLICDLLICDWSSIAFDWLLLDRPTIFLDVPPPFKEGFFLGPEFRFDSIAKNTSEMIELMNTALGNPEKSLNASSTLRASIKNKLYSSYADGNASKRCTQRILEKI
ncbi:CDP-glycerol glycerophosphotransferase family protein [Gilvimarinus algae]|uniref:CDP-glycerol glycerophosphotransferase family protein n=1 Tax=Gilvimarinus algae TaxID=3058037 RepID=A0ABT8TFG9_9GAMM|nr:CDP-glycerol glycerophosphotransferase family protein [Gilvimarinus sp. SDUM040014]MDO3382829.1 CDP-glycerol glycerophosphotransferase family protein [Gilvimarinus sp. SDUM040014]